MVFLINQNETYSNNKKKIEWIELGFWRSCLSKAPGYFWQSVGITNIWKYVDDTTLAECV